MLETSLTHLSFTLIMIYFYFPHFMIGIIFCFWVSDQEGLDLSSICKV